MFSNEDIRVFVRRGSSRGWRSEPKLLSGPPGDESTSGVGGLIAIASGRGSESNPTYATPIPAPANDGNETGPDCVEIPDRKTGMAFELRPHGQT